MPKRSAARGKATKQVVKGHPGIYTLVNIQRDAERERKVVEAIMTRADRPQERVLRS